MECYVRQQSIGEIIRSSLDIYVHNFITIFLLYTIPIIPIQILMNEILAAKKLGIFYILCLLNFIMFLFVWAAITIAISSICLGNKPSVVLSYRHVFNSMPAKLLATNLLQLVVLCLGFILLIVPGFVFMFWFIFTSIVVIMEDNWGLSALKRSKEIGKNNYLRIVGLILVQLISFTVFGFVLGAIFGLLFPHLIGQWHFRLFLSVIQDLVTPLGQIMLILLYYDLRARKESYDITALEEDLKR